MKFKVTIEVETTEEFDRLTQVNFDYDKRISKSAVITMDDVAKSMLNHAVERGVEEEFLSVNNLNIEKL